MNEETGAREPGPLYPDTGTRRQMRAVMLQHLIERPAELTATTLVHRVRENGGARFDERALRLELSRMLGSEVRMNPNRTLAPR